MTRSPNLSANALRFSISMRARARSAPRELAPTFSERKAAHEEETFWKQIPGDRRGRGAQGKGWPGWPRSK